MQPARSWQRSRWGLLIGSGLAVAGCIALYRGAFQRLDDLGLDLHFRYAGSITADPQIVLVDINDHAVEQVGWPWHRRRYAQLVRALHELGARTIVLDLILADPQDPRVIRPQSEAEEDPAGKDRSPTARDAGDVHFIYDDEELRKAMLAAGNVYLGMFFRLAPPDVDPDGVFERALAMVRSDPEFSLDSFTARLHEVLRAVPKRPNRAGLFAARSLFALAHLVALLQDDFRLDADTLGERLSRFSWITQRDIEHHLPAAKRFVARRAAKRFFEQNPTGTMSAFIERKLSNARPDIRSLDRNDLERAFHEQVAARALADCSPKLPESLHDRIAHAFDWTLPLDKFATAAKGIGFVSFPRETGGVVVREIPLVAEAEGRLVSQLGLLVASDALGLDRAAIAATDGAVHASLGSAMILPGQDHDVRLSLDSDGATLINWHARDRHRRWHESFDHVPVSRVLEIALNRAAVEENRTRLGLAMADLVRFRHADTHAQYTDYVRLVNRRIALRSRLADREAGPGGASMIDAGAEHTADNQLTELDAAIEDIEQEALAWLTRLHGLWVDEEPQDTGEQVERDRVMTLYAKLGEGTLAADVRTMNAGLTTRAAELASELKPRIKGRICLVGYTATGVADLVASPVYDSMPGVMAHANIINMILRDRPAWRAAAWLNALITLAGAAVVVLIACRRGPILSLMVLVLLVAALSAAGGIAFHADAFHIASLPGALVWAVVWAGVTAYRQFTEERDRRQFQRALAQYTSPAVAARIAVQADRRDLAPRSARVTCFCSDLAGFTRISEALGPEQTRQVLNPYLELMSRLLVEHGAVVNKFTGDGVFAFFNAPILPCPAHAEAACRCAVDARSALQSRNAQAAKDGLATTLHMRIGLSTGEAFVGDYGSEMKLDYTCIGDTANLGSRLEQANKLFGTSILVDAATRQTAERIAARPSDEPDRRMAQKRPHRKLVFRNVGRITVANRAAPVDVCELLGFSGELDGGTADFVKAFDEMVRHYQACQWDSCSAALQSCAALRPDDRATALYGEAVAVLRIAPPPPGWDGTLLLTDSASRDPASQHI